MKKLLSWAIVPSLLCAAPACVLQTESVSVPSDSGWTEVDQSDGDVYTEGKVGIGTPAPAAELDVVGNVNVAGDLAVTGDARAAQYVVNDASFITTELSSGGVSIWTGGIEALSARTNGDVIVPYSIYAAGMCYGACASDARLKKNVEPLQGALDRLLRLRGVTFEWRDTSARSARESGVQTGFLAQEVETVFPEWVTEGNDGYRRLLVRGFEALSVEALRTLAAQSQDLDGRVRALEETNARLSHEVRALRERDARVKELADELAAERRARSGLEARLATLEAAARRGGEHAGLDTRQGPLQSGGAPRDRN